MSILVLASYVHAHCLTVEHLPSPGESLQATGMLIEHGGKGLNVGVGAHRLEAKVALLLPLGWDVVADEVTEWLAGEDIDSRWAIKVGPQSGFGVGFIGPDGQNFLAIHPGANALLNSEHVEQTLDALPRLNLIYAQFEIPEAPIYKAFEVARERSGVSTMLNPSPWRQPSTELLRLTDILVVNEIEANFLFGLNDCGNQIRIEQWLTELPAWAKRIAWTGELLIVTLGERGCVALSDWKTHYQPAWTIAAVDATGSGDAFNAGLAAALLEKLSLTDALKQACACGAWVAARHGVLGNLPTRAEINKFITTNPIPIKN